MIERSVAVDKRKQNAQLTGGAASGPTGKNSSGHLSCPIGSGYFDSGSEFVGHQRAAHAAHEPSRHLLEPGAHRPAGDHRGSQLPAAARGQPGHTVI
ncbi:hypothetical protein BZG17_32770, partial [Escherichia coli]|nr:hypothetical protein [Escherichia coli]